MAKDRANDGRATNLVEYRDDPVAFVREALPDAGLPYPKQAEMMRLAVSNRRVSVVGCNGSGKDWAVARLVLWWIETREQAKAIVTGPTQRQVDEVLWREMRFAYAMAGRALSEEMRRARYESATNASPSASPPTTPTTSRASTPRTSWSRLRRRTPSVRSTWMRSSASTPSCSSSPATLSS